jgi:methylated-DNA-protein-cysteine methyltransferase-like protein
MTARRARICEIIRRIPAGKVATYGQIAKLAGVPRGARQIGYALSALPDPESVPWHRVINARGEISIRSNPDYAELQRRLLEAEGIIFNDKGCVLLTEYQWVPKEID